MAVLYKLSTSKIERIIIRKIKKAVMSFSLIQDGDRILVGCSGGADSYTLVSLLNSPQFRWYNKIDIIPIHISGGEPFENDRITAIDDFSKMVGININIVHRDIYRFAFSKDAAFNPCFICSRLRRKALIEEADRLKCNKIALAHHKDDLLETFFLNIFFSREISTMMPNQELFKGRFHIIRPLILLNESYAKEYASQKQFPIAPYPCPYAVKSKRKFVKDLLMDIEKNNKGTKDNIFLSLYNPKCDYLLAKYSKRNQNDETDVKKLF